MNLFFANPAQAAAASSHGVMIRRPPAEKKPCQGCGKKKPLTVADRAYYTKPTRGDMAVALTIFSPCGYAAPLMHYRRVAEMFKSAGVPVFTIALAYGDAAPPVEGADFVVRSDSVLFHKENLCNLIEARIPRQFTKIAFVDADLVFDCPRWYDRTSRLLDGVDVCQPMGSCHWTNPDGSEYRFRRTSAEILARGERFSHDWHPGFAWAFRRDFYRAIGGFYEFSLVGGGDVVFVSALEDCPRDRVRFHNGNIPENATAEYDAYRGRIRDRKPRIGFLEDCGVWHLYHGSIENRLYHERVQWMPKGELYRNADGVLEAKDPVERLRMKEYFGARKEDDGLAAA